MTDPTRLLRMAARLGVLTTGRVEADRAIHEVLGLPGAPLLYTHDPDTARRLIPSGFEEQAPTMAAGQAYAAIRRMGLLDGLPHPHHGEWGTTYALALCGACLRAHAAVLAASPRHQG